MIVLEGLFLTISPCDAAEPWQLGFQDAATPMMQGIIDLHHDIFFFLILILVFVSRILVRALWHFHYKKNPIPQRIVHGTTIEILRTIFPSIIPMFIAIPSFALLYSMDEVVVDPAITIKAIGHQWYWTYEYSDYNSSDEQSLTFDSYTIPEDDLEFGQLRLLEVDNRVVVPAKTHLRIIVTSADVLHSWAVPSLGVKCDAVPGRLNQISILVQREGVYYGQCSEICGTNHAIMWIAERLAAALDAGYSLIAFFYNQQPILQLNTLYHFSPIGGGKREEGGFFKPLEVFLGKSEDSTPGHISTMAPSPSGNSPISSPPSISGDSWIERTYGKASSSVPNQGAQGDSATSGGVEQAGPSHQKSGLSVAGQGLPLPSPYDPSSQSSWSGSWIERWMNPEVGSGSEATSQPTGVMQQGNIPKMAHGARPYVPNSSAESSLRGRVLSLENQQSPFLFKDPGEYWKDVRLSLDQATSQAQYNELMRWENGELQVREQKQECFYLFQQILVAFPDLKERARYCYDQQEVFKDFLEEKLAELDNENDRKKKLEEIFQDLRQQNPLSPCIQEILGL